MNRENGKRNMNDMSNKDYLNNPDALTNEIEQHLENMSLSAKVNPTFIDEVDATGMDVGAPVRIDAVTPINGKSLPEVMWEIAVRAKRTNTLYDQSENVVLFSDHKGCHKCGTVTHDPDHELDTCSNCDAQTELSPVNVPEHLSIKERVDFPDSVTPVETDEDLEQALRLLFNTTEINL